MADLATVFGNTGDTGMNNARPGPHNSGSNTVPHVLTNNLKNDNNQYNHPSTQPTTQPKNDKDVDETINKLKTHIENQKKIKK